MPRSRVAHFAGGYYLSCLDLRGRKLWEERVRNQIQRDGEYDILDNWFRVGSAPLSGFYLGLLTTAQVAIPSKSASLATLVANELVAAGYSRLNLTRDTTGWPTLALDDGGNYRCTSNSVTWFAGVTWTAVRWLFLCSVASGTTGRGWSVAQLNQDRVVPIGGSLIASYWAGLS